MSDAVAIRYHAVVATETGDHLGDHKVWVFFYGSYMNLRVLREVDLIPEKTEVARLSGYDLHIAPKANLIQSNERSVYGVLTRATHQELHRLYTEHAHGVLGELYLPEAVLVETLDGRFQAAMTYICWTMTPRPPENDYVQRILTAAQDLKLPSWYLDRIAGFLKSEPA